MKWCKIPWTVSMLSGKWFSLVCIYLFKAMVTSTMPVLALALSQFSPVPVLALALPVLPVLPVISSACAGLSLPVLPVLPSACAGLALSFPRGRGCSVLGVGWRRALRWSGVQRWRARGGRNQICSSVLGQLSNQQSSSDSHPFSK